MRLAGKVALVTGGAQGIGAAVCRAYASEGAHVVIADRADAHAVARQIHEAGGQAVVAPVDVTRAADVQAMIRVAHEAFGPIDVLALCAGIYPRVAWMDITEAAWDDVLAVNLKAALLCAQAVYPDMQARGYGKIITVSSVTVELGSTPFLHYVTSKAGLIGFTRALAREIGPHGVRVNCVMPGAIQTAQELRDFPDQAALAIDMAARQILPYRGTPRDLAGAFVFLATPESDFMTGQVLNIDGGWVHY